MGHPIWFPWPSQSQVDGVLTVSGRSLLNSDGSHTQSDNMGKASFDKEFAAMPDSLAHLTFWQPRKQDECGRL
jgi:hypothetical protein